MHTCPDCGQACYCNGDIDDIESDPTAEDRCHHCGDEHDDDGDADAVADFDRFDPFADKADHLALTIRTAAQQFAHPDTL